MLSPYRQSKENRGLELPEVRTERQYGQRLLNLLRQAEHLGRTDDAHAAQQKFSGWAVKAFPETLRELTPDLHAASDWAILQTHRPVALARAVTFFCGCLLNGKETSIAIPLIRKARQLTSNNRELSAICAINSAIAHKRFSPEMAENDWIEAIQKMPLTEWHRYPSIVQGAFMTLQKLRGQFEQENSFPSLLEAGALAERAFLALSSNTAKNPAFQSMATTVGLMIEISAIHKATLRSGITLLELPSCVEILKLAAVNAGMNTHNPELFAVGLMHLAHHHLQEGDNNTARDYAIQGMLACSAVPGCSPNLTKAFVAILNATMAD
jgi:hypothetical protein